MRARTRTASSSTSSRPGAQLSREQGAIVKDWGGRLPVALAYPNAYYLGMSNLGLHAIYGLLNGHARVVCERVFTDTAGLSVETQRPLSDFAVLAFSVSYEPDCFNVAAMLKAAGLPLYAAARDERHPLVIAGGPVVTANPLPLAPFCDCLCIGEAEAMLPAMLPVLLEGSGGNRQELLKNLAALPGVYVPAFSPPAPVARQWAANLEEFPTHAAVLTPDTELGDLYLIEAERGCQRGCRFCLVNTICSPRRLRSVASLLAQAEVGLKYRQRIGLVGPAVADHPQIEELLAGLNRLGAGIAISSLRISALSEKILDELAAGRTQTVTLAPEAGSRRLRRLLNKDISDAAIIEAVDRIASRGFRQVKLYYMLGLPAETDADAEEIVRLTLAMKQAADRHRGGTRLAVNIGTFVPKAGTPFQWQPMAPLAALNARLAAIKKGLSPKGIKVKTESPAWSRVQGVLARGGPEIAGVLADIEAVTLAGWRQAMQQHGLATDDYVNRTVGLDEKLPWHIIDHGVKPEVLKRELKRALEAAGEG